MPYQWSFSNGRDKRKLVADGRFDPESGYNACGAAVMLKALLDQKIDLFA